MERSDAAPATAPRPQDSALSFLDSDRPNLAIALRGRRSLGGPHAVAMQSLADRPAPRA